METKSIILGVGVGLLAAGILYLLNKDATVPATSPHTTSFYNNDEKMHVWYNKDGMISDIQLKRDAKTGG